MKESKLMSFGGERVRKGGEEWDISVGWGVLGILFERNRIESEGGIVSKRVNSDGREFSGSSIRGEGGFYLFLQD